MICVHNRISQTMNLVVKLEGRRVAGFMGGKVLGDSAAC